MDYKTMKLKRLLNTLSSREFISIEDINGKLYGGYVEDFKRTGLLSEKEKKKLNNSLVRNIYFYQGIDDILTVRIYLKNEEE